MWHTMRVPCFVSVDFDLKQIVLYADRCCLVVCLWMDVARLWSW